MNLRPSRLPGRSILPMTLIVALAASAGCKDDGVVRGAGSINVPKPNTYYSPEEAAANQGGTTPATPADGQ